MSAMFGQSALAAAEHPTHRVATLATHIYETESFKSRDLLRLPFGAAVEVIDERPKMFETPFGFVPKKHMRPLDQLFTDPVTVAQQFFGTPYLWGGNSSLGIDCSGLVQMGLLACGHPCPGTAICRWHRSANLSHRMPHSNAAIWCFGRGMWR